MDAGEGTCTQVSPSGSPQRTGPWQLLSVLPELPLTRQAAKQPPPGGLSALHYPLRPACMCILTVLKGTCRGPATQDQTKSACVLRHTFLQPVAVIMALRPFYMHLGCCPLHEDLVKGFARSCSAVPVPQQGRCSPLPSLMPSAFS